MTRLPKDGEADPLSRPTRPMTRLPKAEEADLVSTPTDELPIAEPSTPPLHGIGWVPPKAAVAGDADPPRRRFAGVSGVLVVVLVLLALGVVGAQVFSVAHGEPGPGALAVTVHLAAALLGIALYRLVSTRSGLTKPVAALALLAMTAAVLWFFWWA